MKKLGYGIMSLSGRVAFIGLDVYVLIQIENMPDVVQLLF